MKQRQILGVTIDDTCNPYLTILYPAGSHLIVLPSNLDISKWTDIRLEKRSDDNMTITDMGAIGAVDGNIIKFPIDAEDLYRVTYTQNGCTNSSNFYLNRFT